MTLADLNRAIMAFCLALGVMVLAIAILLEVRP